MKFGLYSVFDAAVGAYLPPFVLITDKAAVRAFALCARDPGHAFCQSAVSYRLFRVGTFDDETGSVVQMLVPALLCDAQAAQVSGAVAPTGVPIEGYCESEGGKNV